MNIGSHNIRMDCLTLGDIVATSNSFDEIQVFTVTNLELIGDDVTVNGWLTSSKNNTITVLWVESN